MSDLALESLKQRIKERLPDEVYHEGLGIYGPFGANGGLEVLYKLIKWRNENPDANLEEFLKELRYPIYDWHNLNELDIKKYISNSDNEISQALTPDVIAQMLGTIEKYYKEQTGNDITLNKEHKGDFNSGTHIIEQDLAVIATAFGQYVIEGTIDINIKELAESALRRQTLDIFINLINDNTERSNMKNQFELMLSDLSKIVK